MLDTGTRLNELRVKHKMTHQQLADESGVPIGTVKSILSGQTQNAGFSTVCALLEAMNEPITEFYTRKTEQEDEEEEQKPAKKQLAPQHIQPQPCFQRVEMRALAKEAVAEVYRDDLVIAANREKNWWRAIAIVFLLISFFWLQWEIRHPHEGIFQYGASAQEAVGWIRSLFQA